MVAVRPHRAQKIKPGRGHSCKEWDSCSLFHLYPTLPARPTNDDSRVPVGTPCHRVAGGGAFDLKRAGSHEENEEDDKENEDDTKRNERRKRKSRTLGHVPRPLSPVRSVQRRVKSETNSTV
ncbi:unnamed protein product [Prorocentrum cordatum]|uniref:Uncharacterized protein n=1 Tax=Prorocentrum cordatum TaxID=2364126 RepID=A0ABN9QZT4_9DINO|nr:unnamed protein product [Polarella glacialis]